MIQVIVCVWYVALRGEGEIIPGRIPLLAVHPALLTGIFNIFIFFFIIKILFGSWGDESHSGNQISR